MDRSRNTSSREEYKEKKKGYKHTLYGNLLRWYQAHEYGEK